MYPSGTDDSISRLVAEYSPMLLRLACTRLHSPADAEDAVQEAFLRLLTASPRFRDAQHEKAWLIRTTLHRAADIQRAAARKNVPLEEATGVQTEESGLLAAVRSLPEKYSAVLYLHYYEGGIPSRRSQNCWACLPPRWAPAWRAAGNGCGG